MSDREPVRSTPRIVTGVVVRGDADQILMVRRSDDGTWGLPGGGVHSGETWEQAAVRECLEETGWRVLLTGLLGLYSDPASQTHRYPNGDVVQFYGAVFLGAPASFAGGRDNEATDVGWHHINALSQPLFLPDVQVLSDVIAYRGVPFIR